MAVLAWCIGVLAGLCAVMGVATGAGAFPVIGEEMNGLFWLVLSGVLFLASLLLFLSRGEY